MQKARGSFALTGFALGGRLHRCLSDPLQNGNGEPPLPLARILDTSIPAPLPLNTRDIPLPYVLNLQTCRSEPFFLKKLPHGGPTRVETSYSPTSRFQIILEEPLDRLEQIVVLPGHPQTVTNKHPLKGMVISLSKRCGQLAPRMTFDLDLGKT